MDVRDAEPAGRLQEDPARARAVARARFCPGHRPGDRSRAPRADSADGSREQERDQGAGRGLPGRSEIRPDRDDDRGARREHRQGRVQGRRSVLHVFPGGLVRRQGGVRALAGGRVGPGADLSDSRQLTGASRHLRHRRGRQRRRLGRLCSGGRVYGHDGRLGLHGVGLGLVLPAVLGLRRLLSVLLPAFPDLRVLGLVQPVDRRLWTQRRHLRTVRRRRGGCSL